MSVANHSLSFSGRILYLPDPNSEACPYRTYDMTSKDTDWSHIVHKGMWSRPDDRIDNIVFLDKQVCRNEYMKKYNILYKWLFSRGINFRYIRE